MRISDWSSDVCSSDLPQLYALSHVVAVAPDTSSVYGTTPIAQYHGLHASDFITTPATIAGASAASDAGSYTLSASGATASDPAYRFVYLPAVLTVPPEIGSASWRDRGCPDG